MIKAERFSFTFDADDGTGVSSIGLVIVNVRCLGVHRSKRTTYIFPSSVTRAATAVQPDGSLVCAGSERGH